jgi:hypothetical protein
MHESSVGATENPIEWCVTFVGQVIILKKVIQPIFRAIYPGATSGVICSFYFCSRFENKDTC